MKFDRWDDGTLFVTVSKAEIRRAAKLRMKAKARRIKRDIKDAEHLAVCSCRMCCNQRRNHWLRASERLTMQERRNLDL